MITGIVAEYNPFHNGHKYLTDSIRQSGSTHIIAVMGGNFLQRGNCAVMDKYRRAKAAVLGGVDLVLELPVVYAVSGAERFAFGAVATLDGCGCADMLAFGSECGDIAKLTRAAEIASHNGDVGKLCREYVKQGYSHPRAVQAAVSRVMPDNDNFADVLSKPNNTLAIEYLRALKSVGSSIKPVTLKRKGAMHGSDITNGGFASASAVREMIAKNNISYEQYIPESMAEIIKGCVKSGECPAEFQNNERGVLTVLRRMTAADFAALPDVTEGLENRLAKAVGECGSVSDIITYVKCKRYTHARLSRIIASAYLGLTKDTAKLSPEYIRVLAFNDRGTEILKLMKKTARLPIVMFPAKDIRKLDENGRQLLALDLRASELYALLTPEIQRCGTDFYNGAVKI